MDTRTQIATMVLQGIVANPEVEKSSTDFIPEKSVYIKATANTAVEFADALISTLNEDYGEWNRYSKKEMWEEIQKVRKLVKSDGSQTICEDIQSYAEQMAELS